MVRGDIDLTPTQQSTLYQIAIQCPNDGGAVVYAARSAWSAVQDTLIEWPDNCGDGLTEGGQDRQQPAIPSERVFAIQPNPVMDDLRIQLPESTANERIVVINDVRGRVLRTQSCPAMAGQYLLPTTDLPHGVFILQILEDGIPVFTRKLIKI